MKNHLSKIIPFALATALSIPVFTGCSSTASRESAGEYIDDSVITTKVKAALARDEIVNGFAVKVETFKGTVQLSGFVNSAAEKRQAEMVASGVSGVQQVSNNILVKSEDAAASTR